MPSGVGLPTSHAAHEANERRLRETQPASDARAKRLRRNLFLALLLGAALLEHRPFELFEFANELRIDLRRRNAFFRRLFFDGFRFRDTRAFFALGEIAGPRLFRFGFARNIEAPTRQPRSQTNVLSFAPNRKRKLIVGDRDESDAFVLEQFHAKHLRRCERVVDERYRVGRPADDVDFLPAQFVGDRGDAARLRTETGADRVDFEAMRMDRDFGAAARFARDRHDLDDVVVDLGNLALEQALHQAFRRTREDDLRTLIGLAHVEHEGVDAVVDSVVLARHLFRERQKRFGAAEVDIHVALFVTLHRPVDDVVQLLAVLVEDCVALRFANALNDDLLCRLRRNPPKTLRRDLFVVIVTRFVLPSGFLLRDLDLRIFDVLDDGPAMIDLVFAGVAIHVDHDVGLAAVIALVGGNQRRFERFEQHLARNRALALEDAQGFAQGRFVG